ncbi:MAG: dipeptide ABC transporter ATP-binding protein [Lachnospiraceae bacterium]|nr:dipeptide ABC transporter ATP-binding protein [Lachnospiraceae bacterium]
MEEKREAVLRADNIKKYFPIRNTFGKVINNVKAVDGISLELYRGETYGLVGETGCGKSTLGRTLINLMPATEGDILFEGRNIAGMSERQVRPLRKKMQMIFQDPYTSLDPRMRVGDILAEVLQIQNIGKKEERQDMVMDMLGKVGLRPEQYYHFPHEFSGGQRQRIGLARAFILDPEFVVCDEPVSALDVSVQSQIINLLQDIQQEKKLTYLFISHDMSVIRYTSDRVGVMYLGHLVEEALTDYLFAKPLHPYTQVLMSAVPSANPHVKKKRIVLEGELPSPLNPPSGCVFHTRCPYAKDICRRECPQLREADGQHKVACHQYQ